jgi:MOSC domain-containing protein YiiM
MTGRLIGIARRDRKRAPMEELDRVLVEDDAGLEGDYRGRFPNRGVTVIAREAWEAALADLDDANELPWTLRRANLLVEQIELPREPGHLIQVGGALLRITGETDPCGRMEEQRKGLMAALTPDWRGGITCVVVQGGEVALGDQVKIVEEPA